MGKYLTNISLFEIHVKLEKKTYSMKVFSVFHSHTMAYMSSYTNSNNNNNHNNDNKEQKFLIKDILKKKRITLETRMVVSPIIQKKLFF